MPMNARLLRPLASRSLFDADAAAYLTAVQNADNQALEPAVRNAITAFVIGCKQDGIWSAIKASCILMGARTLSGALTPLVGTAPTNNGPFVSGDYNRETGLIGNASTKYLNSGRANNADGQNDQHLSAYVSVASGDAQAIIGAGGTGNGASGLVRAAGGGTFAVRSRNNTISLAATVAGTGFIAKARSASGSFVARNAAANETFTVTSQTPTSDNIFVFCRNNGSGTPEAYSSARIAFYSVGSSLTLSLLDSRVTTLYNAIGAAIP